MKSFIIAIQSLPESMDMAQRCIDSAKNYNMDVEIFPAITPKDDPEKILINEEINFDKFKNNIYSRYLNSLSCFLSHYFLWKKCIEIDEPRLILEHDAVFVDKLDTNTQFSHLLSIGKPSYGRFNIPKTVGVNKLTSKKYLPGAHAYIVKPNAAVEIVNMAKTKAEPTDVFLNMNNFPWIQEYYPWVVEVRDTFSTVQQVAGSIAKHSYNPNYIIKEF